MKLVKLYFDHLRMFKNGKFELDLFASDKVPATDESASELLRPIYSNNVIALAGINASGKSTALRLIELAARIINGKSIGEGSASLVMATMFDGPSTFRCLVWHGASWYLVESVLFRAGDVEEQDNPPISFGEERVYSIPAGKLTKKVLASWDDLLGIAQLRYQRTKPDQGSFIVASFDVSICSAVISQDVGARSSMLVAREEGFRLRQTASGLDAILKVFDSRIEHLDVLDAGRAFSLKFTSDAAPMTLSEEGLSEVLSSGTVRGVSLVSRAMGALNSGGYLLVDEIENHLNRQLVNVVLDLFASRSTNPHGAVLVFTTHYPQVLDHIHRKDNVYFMVKGSDGASEVVKYSTRVKRIENKKSEVYASNYVKGTAPRYVDVRALKSHIAEVVSRG